MSGDRRVDHDSQVDGKQVVVSMERPHRPAVCPEVPHPVRSYRGPYFRILTFSDADFCSSQLASSSVVPRGLLPMRFGVIVRPFHARVTFWPILDNLGGFEVERGTGLRYSALHEWSKDGSKPRRG